MEEISLRTKRMNPLELFKAGKLDEAIGALGEQLRQNPADGKGRTFLFELLCFAGNYDRAEKQLDILGQSGPQAELGAIFCRGLLQATRTREEVYSHRRAVAAEVDGKDAPGVLDGVPFQSLVDADLRVGANLEVYAGGSYLLIPFSLVQSVELPAPRRLRDLLWIPAVIRTTPAYQGRELGETMLPALTPFSAAHPSDAVRLGRETVWETTETGDSFPAGQKIWLADGEEKPLLEARKLEFVSAAAAS